MTENTVLGTREDDALSSIKVDFNSQPSYVKPMDPNERNVDKGPTKLEFASLLLLIILAVGVGCGAIAYIVLGILYLVQGYHIADGCDDSNLWAYVLTAVILSFSRLRSKDSFDKNTEFGDILCGLFCLGLLECGLAIWGGLELWDYSCDDINETNLWKFGLATFCIQTFFASLFLVIMPISLYCIAKYDSYGRRAGSAI